MVLSFGVLGAGLATAKPTHAAGTSPAIASALADKARPETDTSRDTARKPAALLAFARVHPGEKVGELLPGGGYFTRLLSKTVGDAGAVYSWISMLPHPSR
jgi:predicted methyltransferase